MLDNVFHYTHSVVGVLHAVADPNEQTVKVQVGNVLIRKFTIAGPEQDPLMMLCIMHAVFHFQ